MWSKCEIIALSALIVFLLSAIAYLEFCFSFSYSSISCLSYARDRSAGSSKSAILPFVLKANISFSLWYDCMYARLPLRSSDLVLGVVRTLLTS
jgi:hypothetical protein